LEQPPDFTTLFLKLSFSAWTGTAVAATSRPAQSLIGERDHASTNI
jgi:hypothetical protein